MKFLGEDWFDAVALFEYHDEPLASSSSLADKVDAQTMRARFLQAKKLVEKLQEQRALSAPKENI